MTKSDHVYLLYLRFLYILLVTGFLAIFLAGCCVIIILLLSILSPLLSGCLLLLFLSLILISFICKALEINSFNHKYLLEA